MPHTLGPWFYELHLPEGSADGIYQIVDRNDVIANLDPNDVLAYGERNEELEANAQLIASAPDLLKALRDTLSYVADRFGIDASAESVWKQGQAAIKRAEGRE